MLPTSYFIPVHRKSRAGAQTQKAKRKRHDADTDDTDLDNASTSGKPHNGEQPLSEGELSAPGHSSSAFGPKQRELHRSSNHRAPSPERATSGREIDTSLGKLKSPLLGREQYPYPGLRERQRFKGSGTRQRHLAVLTAIMHRSLLQHDYARVGRAWALLLRSEVNGHSVDLRDGDKWGLGAEIILRRHGEISQASDHIRSPVENGLNALNVPETCLYSDGFDKARQYYDRLTLQYPYHKSFPDATGPLNFHFAIFSLWIYISTRQEALEVDLHRNTPAYSPDGQLEPDRMDDSQQKASHRASEISQQLGELVSSPPYSDSEMFRKLKAMVDRWTADLAIANLRDDTDPSTVGAVSERSINKGSMQ